MEHQEYEVRTDVLTDYRTRFPPIRLFDDGSVPTEQLHWKNAHDFDQIARILQNTWTAISSVSRPVARRTPSAVDKRQSEIARAWNIWLRSHHAFFCLFTLLAHSYERMIRIAKVSNGAGLMHWALLTGRLWAASGALMKYGVDFEPCREIYCERIRPEMPAGFSGFWLREWIRVKAASSSWQTLDHSGYHLGDNVVRASSNVTTGRCHYNRYHAEVMTSAVADGKSLLRTYKSQLDGPLLISEEQFSSYDEWFRVERVHNLPRRGFVESTCRIIREVVADLTTGTGLDHGTLLHISGGFDSAIQVFGEWLRPVPPEGEFYRNPF
jgi:hypothetical protein